MGNKTVANITILLFAVLIAFVTAYPAWQREKARKKEFVIHEEVQCVASVCVEHKHVGRECQILDQSVASVIIAVDGKNPKHAQVIVETTSVPCR